MRPRRDKRDERPMCWLVYMHDAFHDDSMTDTSIIMTYLHPYFIPSYWLLVSIVRVAVRHGMGYLDSSHDAHTTSRPF